MDYSFTGRSVCLWLFGGNETFVHCVGEGEEPRETFEDGYIVNAILDAGYKSMKTGKWEKIEY